MMKITREKLFIALFFIIALTNLAIFYNPGTFLLGLPIFFSLLSIPGILILLLLKVKNLDFWRYVLFTASLSVAFLMLSGLLINFVGYTFFHVHPLHKLPLLFAYNILLIPLFITAYLRNAKFKYKIRFKIPNRLHKFLLIFPPVITALSVMGAVSLNNQGTNLFTMVALGGIAVGMGILLFFYKHLKEYVFPYTIYFFSLSLLLMLSLRSWYISGWDIQDEFKIFQLTKDIGYWSVSNIKHDYNSCLSLTILPTIISNLTGISGTYVFKLLYQILFALVPLAVYLQSRRYITSIISFFGAVYFISQPFFIQPMTALMRQEIAFLFFAVLVFAVFEKSIGRKTKYIFFTLFSASMIVSHYSTTYIASLLFLLAYVTIFIYHRLEKLKLLATIFQKFGLKVKRNYFKYHYYISPIYLVILLSLSILWYSVVNSNVRHALEVSDTVVKNISNIFNTEVANKEVKTATALLNTEQINTFENIKIYNFY